MIKLEKFVDFNKLIANGDSIAIQDVLSTFMSSELKQFVINEYNEYVNTYNKNIDKIDDKKYDIWMEGYHSAGSGAPAKFLGSFDGLSFDHAVLKYINTNKKGFEQLFNEEKLTIWGCKLFDNEKDARRSFG